jgi:predicted lipid-binding transport protein (Tim44 family)
LKRSEPGAGVAAQPFSLASVPGSIPSHVRPPRTAEFADTPYSTGAAAVPTPAQAVAPAPWRASVAVRTASAEPGAVEQEAPAATSSSSSSSSGSLFGGLFGGSKSSTASTATATAKSSDGPMDKMAKLIGLRSSDPVPPPPAAEPAPAPKPRAAPTARANTSSNGAIRPKPAEPATRTAEAPAPAFAPAPAPAAAAPASTMSGSAPTVPAGSFENRWSSFR